MSDEARLVPRAAELRQAFDASFALPPATPHAELEDLLAVRIAGEPQAIRLRDITELVKARAIVPLPSRAAGLLGLAGIRGEIVPVFSLSVLLGRGEESEPARWLVVCGQREALALGFSVLEGYLRVPRSAVSAQQGAPGLEHVTEVAATDEGTWPVIGVPRLIAQLRRGPGHPRRDQEP